MSGITSDDDCILSSDDSFDVSGNDGEESHSEDTYHRPDKKKYKSADGICISNGHISGIGNTHSDTDSEESDEQTTKKKTRKGGFQSFFGNDFPSGDNDGDDDPQGEGGLRTVSDDPDSKVQKLVKDLDEEVQNGTFRAIPRQMANMARLYRESVGRKRFQCFNPIMNPPPPEKIYTVVVGDDPKGPVLSRGFISVIADEYACYVQISPTQMVDLKALDPAPRSKQSAEYRWRKYKFHGKDIFFSGSDLPIQKENNRPDCAISTGASEENKEQKPLDIVPPIVQTQHPDTATKEIDMDSIMREVGIGSDEGKGSSLSSSSKKKQQSVRDQRQITTFFKVKTDTTRDISKPRTTQSAPTAQKKSGRKKHSQFPQQYIYVNTNDAMCVLTDLVTPANPPPPPIVDDTERNDTCASIEHKNPVNQQQQQHHSQKLVDMAFLVS